MRAALVDAVLDTTRHRLDADAPPERACAEAWMRRVREDAVRGGRGDGADAWGGALWGLLGRCADAAAALARVRLDARLPAPERAEMLERLARLGAALDEAPDAWRFPLVRLRPLAALPAPVWDALQRAPAWVVVRALADTGATGEAYRRGVATLAHRPGAWAVVPVRRAARHVRLDDVADADPERLGTLLAQWPWPAVDPPLAMVSAWVETGRTRLDEDVWAAGVHCAASSDDIFVVLWASAEAHARAVECLAPRLRAEIDERFTRRAVAHIAHWLPGTTWTDAECAAAMARARVVLVRMRALWAREPLLAPRSPSEHALRLVPADALSLFPDDPEDTHERLRPARVLVWRVPCTSPERAVVANHGLATFDATLGRRTSFDVAVGEPDAPMARTYPADPPSPARERRERAVSAILARLAAELRP